MKKRSLIIGIVGFTLILCCLPFFAAADFTPGKWAYSRHIIVPNPAAASEYVTVELDGQVYEHAPTSLNDLRVIDDQGVEVASIVQQMSAETRVPISTKIINHQIEKGRSIYTVDAGENINYNGLQISTDSRNFSRRVTVEGSNNGVWAMLRDDGYVMDFSRDETALSLRINFTSTSFRYLRVTIFDKNEAALAVSAIELFSTEQVTNPLRLLATEIISQTQDAKLRASIITLTFDHLKTPNSQLEVITENTNFHRRVEIESCASTPENKDLRCTHLSSGNIFDINIDRVNARNLIIDYQEARSRLLRIKIFNYDDQPLKIRGVKISGYPRQLLFKREANRSYKLMYGNEKVSAPQYDLAQLSAYLKTTNLTKLQLGTETKLALISEVKTSESSRNPIWLWAVIVIAIGFLGTLIYRLAKMNTEK